MQIWIAPQHLINSVFDVNVMSVDVMLREHESIRFLGILGQRRPMPAVPDPAARAAHPEMTSPRRDPPAIAELR